MKKYLFYLFTILGVISFIFLFCENNEDPINPIDPTPTPPPTPTTTPGVGDIGPAGGYIFYDKGSYSDGWRYLEAAPKSTEWNNVEWGCPLVEIGAEAQGTAIGDGKNNTAAIVAGCDEEGIAAKLCDELVVTNNGTTYDDWFLPSKDEVDLITENIINNDLEVYDGFKYWTSSEVPSPKSCNAWVSLISIGFWEDTQVKTNNYFVRAVRQF